MEDDAVKQVEMTAQTSTCWRLEQVAKAREVNLRAVVLEALEQYLQREEAHAAWMREGDEALKHYEETGLHLTGEEVEEWLARLEEGDDVDLPPCHI
ncbi:MAG: CopG family transcriptional regulator [Pseudomonadota bacterium]